MPEDQRRILEMLASKQITVEQADRLLEAVTPVPPRYDTPPQPRLHHYQHQRQLQQTHTTVTHGNAPSDGGAYLREMRALGLRNLGSHDIIALKATGVTGDFVRDLRAHGLDVFDANDVIALKATGVDGAYIQDLQAAGLERVDANTVSALKSQDIDGAYVRRMRSAGFAELDPHDLIALKAQGIDAPDDEEHIEENDLSKETQGDSASGAETVRLLSVCDEADATQS